MSRNKKIETNYIKSIMFSSWEEERACYLENLALKLVREDLSNLTMSEEVLNLHVMVEDLYEKTVGPNDANLSVKEMMKSIELLYRREHLELDKVTLFSCCTVHAMKEVHIL